MNSQSSPKHQITHRGTPFIDRNPHSSPNLNGSKTQTKSIKRNSSLRQLLLEANYGKFFTNKSAQFFYFWARTRLVQRAIMILSALWILLIFYKSLLIVELMRHDVNVKKETVEALLPKGIGLPKLIKQNYLYTTAGYDSVKFEPSVLVDNTHQSSEQYSTTIDYFKRHFQSLVSQKTQKSTEESHNDGGFSWEANKSPHLDNSQSWKSLSAYHWLTLFSYYNVSLYNRYVAILPQINLYRYA